MKNSENRQLGEAKSYKLLANQLQSFLFCLTTYELKKWNDFNEYVYNIKADTKIIVEKTIYEHICPCKDIKG